MKVFKSALVLLCMLGGISCSEKSDKAFLVPTSKTVVDTDTVFDPKVDILFVIDDSGSMSGHQANLAANIGLFTSVFLTKSVLDYNIGVITTSVEAEGHLNGTTRFVTKGTVNANQVLADNITVGINGSGAEAPFATTLMAFDPAALSGANSGFLREDAALIVIFITDAEDQSQSITAQKLLNDLLLIKKGDKRKLLAFGAIIPSNNTLPNCDRDDGSTTPRKIEEFLGIVPNAPNNILNLCSPDFGTPLAGFASEIVERTGLTIYLTRQPDVDTIKVIYGEAELPNDPDVGWTFDTSRNAIQLGSKIDWESQPSGSRVKVFYKKGRVKELNL